MRPWSLLLGLALLSSTALAQTAEEAKGFRPLTAALHVHSQFSNGEYQVFELAAYAHQKKIDVLGITDSFLTRVRYGVGPWRKLVSRTMTRNGVVDVGVDEFFSAATVAQRQFDDVVLLPGVELAPYYYWKGSWPGKLELYDFDRHIVAFGLKDRDVVRNLPVIENETWSNTSHQWFRAAGPALTALSATLLIAIGIAGRRRRFWLSGALLLIITGLWTYDAYPLGELSDPYSGSADMTAFQRTIDYVTSHNGLAYWSYPEARYPDIQSRGATMISRGQPQTLALSDNYQGFEGIYGDKITITAPGNLWDQILLEYLRGGRKTWPSVITGIDFHSFKDGNGWYQLDQGLTMLFTREKTEAAVLDALKAGRGYATAQPTASRRVLLSDFALKSGSDVAIAGETLKTSGAIEVTANLSWSGDVPQDGTAAATIVELVLDGKLLESYRGNLPLHIQRSENIGIGKHYVRIRMHGEKTELLSNPIFVERS